MVSIDKIRTIEPLIGKSYVSAIHLLLVHALRNGMIEGNANSLKDAIDQAARRGDRTVQWSQPKAPVIARYVSNQGNRFDFSKPASDVFIPTAIEKLNGVSDFATRFVSHDIRAGSLRNLAHITLGKTLGVANRAVSKAAGQTYNAVQPWQSRVRLYLPSNALTA